MNHSTAVEQLATLIKDFLNTHPKMSLNRLASEAHVSEASLRRVTSGETKSAPNISLSIKVLRRITGEKSFLAICEAHRGPLSDYLCNELAVDQLSDEQEAYKKLLQDKVCDPSIFHVTALAGSPTGVSEEQVEDFFGIEGIKALMYLYENNYLSLIEGKFHTNEKGISFNREIFLPVLRKTIELIDTKSSPMESDNFFYLWTSSMNPKGIEKVRKLKLDTYQKLKKLTNDPKLQGEKHLFFIGAFDSFEKDGLLK